MNQIEIRLPYPPSANAYWRAAPRRGLVPSSKALKYKAAVAQLALENDALPLLGPVVVTVRVYRPRASGDLDNTLKVLFDALKFVAWMDDSQVVELHAQREEDPQKVGWVVVTASGERCASSAEVAAAKEAVRLTSEKRRRTLALNRLRQEAAA